MITKVKCTKEGCEWKDRVFTTTALYFSKIVPLDGPFPCPKCGKPMKVVDRVLAKYKGNAGAKASPRRTTANPVSKKPVGKKRKSKGIKLMGRGNTGNIRFGKPPNKKGPKKPGPRKRGPSKS